MSSVSASIRSIFARLTSIDLYVPQTTSPGDTITTAGLARDAATIPVSAITSFADLDPIAIIGDGGTELNAVNGAPSGSNIVPARKIVIAQSSGARVLEMVKRALGGIGEGSARMTGSGNSTPITDATSNVPVGYLITGGNLGFAFALKDFSMRSLALAFGQDELETGAGTSGDPYQNLFSQNTIGTHSTPLCARLKGVRKDGKIIEVDFLDLTLTPNADINLSGKADQAIPVSGNCTGIITRFY